MACPGQRKTDEGMKKMSICFSPFLEVIDSAGVASLKLHNRDADGLTDNLMEGVVRQGWGK
jgi:hypothetical protein